MSKPAKTLKEALERDKTAGPRPINIEKYLNRQKSHKQPEQKDIKKLWNRGGQQAKLNKEIILIKTLLEAEKDPSEKEKLKIQLKEKTKLKNKLKKGNKNKKLKHNTQTQCHGQTSKRQ